MSRRRGVPLSEETRAKLRAAALARYEDPAERAAAGAASKARWADPEYARQVIEAVKETWTDPETRAKRRLWWDKRACVYCGVLVSEAAALVKDGPGLWACQDEPGCEARICAS